MQGEYFSCTNGMDYVTLETKPIIVQEAIVGS
jgi:hypothetical protein